MINQVSLVPKTFNGQRVVTFKDIDAVHERPEGTARRNFNQNKQYFIEGEDFYRVNQGNISMYENRTLENIPPKGITVFTQTGYLMLVKSFHDDLAWQVQRQLVNVYFKVIEMAEQNGQPKLAQNYIQIPLPDYSGLLARIDVLESALRMHSSEQFFKTDCRMESLEQRMDDFTKNMTNLSKFIVDKMEKFDMQLKQEHTTAIIDNMVGTNIADEEREWKKKAYELMNGIVLHSNQFEECKDIFKYMYNVMRREDGAVWEQYEKEYRWKYDIEKGARVRRIDVCYDNEVLRSIFMNKLETLAYNCGAVTSEYITDTPAYTIGEVMPAEIKRQMTVSAPLPPINDIIQPLVDLRGDTSMHGVVTYKQVYQYMDEMYGVSWKNNETRYISKNGRKPDGRKAVIMDNPRLYIKFRKAVKDLIKQTEQKGVAAE